MKINVVGAGIAGSLVAKTLRYYGHQVSTISDGGPLGASWASANLFYTGWLKSWDRNKIDQAVQLINMLDIPTYKPFHSGGGIGVAKDVQRILPRYLLESPNIIGQVRSVVKEGVILHRENKFQWQPQLVWEKGKDVPTPTNADKSVYVTPVIEADITIVAAGWRGAELFPHLRDSLKFKIGHALFCRGGLAANEVKLELAAPYKHSKLMNYGDGRVYYSDSVARRPSTYWRDREELIVKTRNQFFNRAPHNKSFTDPNIEIGIRPIIKGHPFGYLEYVENSNAYIINGGGKNGILAYAYQAAKLVEEIGHA